MTEPNPYEAPQVEVADVEPPRKRQYKASPWVRLVAVIIDNLLYLPAWIAYVIGIVLSEQEFEGDEFQFTPEVVLGLVVALVLAAIVFGIQLWMLNQNGWTVGKRVMQIRIVRTDGSRAGLGRIFWLRMFLPGAIGAVPCAGPLFGLIDALYIFGEKTRCVHDYMADTIVVKA